MPLTVKCKGCGYTLYGGSLGIRPWETIHSLVSATPELIYDRHKGECPKCKRRLEMPTSKNIRISPNPEFFPVKKEEGGEIDDND